MNRDSDFDERRGTFSSIAPLCKAVSALFCQFCQLNVHIFVRNFQFFNLSNGMHNSAVVFSSEEDTYGRVRLTENLTAEIHGSLPWENQSAILSVFA